MTMTSRAQSASTEKSTAKRKLVGENHDIHDDGSDCAQNSTGILPQINVFRASTRTLSTPATPASIATSLGLAPTPSSASSSVRHRVTKRTLGQELDGIDALLESLYMPVYKQPDYRDRSSRAGSHKSAHSSSFSRIPRSGSSENDEVELNPIRFTADKLIFNHVETSSGDAISIEIVNDAPARVEKMRIARNPFEMNLPIIGKDITVNLNRELDTSTNHSASNVSRTVIDDSEIKTNKKNEENQSQRALAEMQTEEGELFHAEQEILRLMKCGCTREAAQFCRSSLEKLGELPSLVSMFRKLLKLLKASSSTDGPAAKVIIKTAASIWVGDDIPISYRIYPIGIDEEEFKATGIIALFEANEEQDKHFLQLIEGARTSQESENSKKIECEIDDLMTMDSAIIRLPVAQKENSLLLSGRCISKEGNYILRYYKSPMDILPVSQSKTVSVIRPAVSLECPQKVCCDSMMEVSFSFFNKREGENIVRQSGTTQGDLLKMRWIGPAKQNVKFDDIRLEQWTNVGRCKVQAPNLPGDYAIDYFSEISGDIIGEATFHAKFEQMPKPPEESGVVQCYVMHDAEAVEEVKSARRMSSSLDRLCEVLGLLFNLKSLDDAEALRNEAMHDVLTTTFRHIGDSNYLVAFLAHDYSKLAGSSTTGSPVEHKTRPEDLTVTSIRPSKQGHKRFSIKAVRELKENTKQVPLEKGNLNSADVEKTDQHIANTNELSQSQKTKVKAEKKESQLPSMGDTGVDEAPHRVTEASGIQAVTGSTSLMTMRRSALVKFGSRGDLRALAKAGVIRKFFQREALLRAGDVLDAFYVVASGQFIDSTNKSFLPGEILGADGFLFGHPIVYDIVCSEEGSVLEIPKGALAKVSKSFKANVLNFLRESTKSFKQSDDESDSFDGGQQDAVAEAESKPEELMKRGLRFWEMRSLAARSLKWRSWIPSYCSIVEKAAAGGRVRRNINADANHAEEPPQPRPFEWQFAYGVHLRPQLSQYFLAFQMSDSCLSPRTKMDEYSESLNQHIRSNYETFWYKAPKENGATKMISSIGTRIYREHSECAIDPSSVAFSNYLEYVSQAFPNNLSRYVALASKLSNMLESKEWSARSKTILITGGPGAGKTWLLLKFVSEFEDFASRLGIPILRPGDLHRHSPSGVSLPLFLSVNIKQFHFTGGSLRSLLTKIQGDLVNSFQSLRNRIVLSNNSLELMQSDLIDMIQIASREARIVFVIDNWEYLGVTVEWLETLSRSSPNLILIISRVSNAASFKTVYRMQHVANVSISLDNMEYQKDRIRISVSFMQNYLAACNFVAKQFPPGLSLEGVRDFITSHCPNASAAEVTYLLMQQFERDQRAIAAPEADTGGQKVKKGPKVDLDVTKSFLQSLVEQDPDLLICFRFLALVRSGLTVCELASLFEGLAKKRMLRASVVREILVARHVWVDLAGVIVFSSEGLRLAAHSLFGDHETRAKYLSHVFGHFSNLSSRSSRRLAILGQLSLDVLHGGLPALGDEDGLAAEFGLADLSIGGEEKKDAQSSKQREQEEARSPSLSAERQVVDWLHVVETLVFETGSAAAAGFCPRVRAVYHDLVALLIAQRRSSSTAVHSAGNPSAVSSPQSELGWAEQLVWMLDNGPLAREENSNKANGGEDHDSNEEHVGPRIHRHNDPNRLAITRKNSEIQAYGLALSKEERALIHAMVDRQHLCKLMDLASIVELMVSHASGSAGWQGAVLALLRMILHELYGPTSPSAVEELGQEHAPVAALACYEVEILSLAADAAAVMWGVLHQRFMSWAVNAKRTVENVRRLASNGDNSVASTGKPTAAAPGPPSGAAAGARLQAEKMGLMQEAHALIQSGRAIASKLSACLAQAGEEEAASDIERTLSSSAGPGRLHPRDLTFQPGVDDAEDIFFPELRAHCLFRRRQPAEQLARVNEALGAAAALLRLLDPNPSSRP